MHTRSYLPLLQREWLQHRFGWALLALIPFGLALVMASFGQIQFDDGPATMPDRLPLLLAVGPVLVGVCVMLAIALITAFFIVPAIARRDHGDRSIEYWLSLPVPHSAALAVPLFVHLVLMPAAAILVGWLGGHVLGAVLVARVAGIDALADLPWAAAAAASAALLLRFLAGLPLAMLWALPIILLLVLMHAWFKRWGWVMLAAGILLLGLLEQFSRGQRWLLNTATELMRRAGQSFLGAGGVDLSIDKGSDGAQALLSLPALATRDFAAALAALASPLFIGGLLFSAACFALLLHWRQTAAGRSD